MMTFSGAQFGFLHLGVVRRGALYSAMSYMEIANAFAAYRDGPQAANVIAVLFGVTGRFKTGHDGALQNRPVLCDG